MPYCWFHGSSFKGFPIVFPVPWLAKVESSQKSNGMWFFRHCFAQYLFHPSRNNRCHKQRSKFWREKMFRKPHLKLLRWCLVRDTNQYDFEGLSSICAKLQPASSKINEILVRNILQKLYMGCSLFWPEWDLKVSSLEREGQLVYK